MSERVGLNPKWFEPGKNFKTMFGEHVRKNRMRGISVEECISAAFRALLAGEAVPVDKDAKDAEIARLRAKVERLTAERDALQAQLLQVESFVRENNAPPARISKLINQRQELAILNSKYIEAKHQRDALRARIDAGVPVTEMTGHSYELPRWFEGLVKTNDDQRTGILLIDARPIDQPDAAMVDERTGLTDRRTGWPPLYVRQFSRYGLPDRRRTTGTIADRDKP